MIEEQGPSSENIAALLSRLAREEYCYVTTVGRVSGNLHKIEIWFGLRGDTIYLLSGGGGRSDWVRNMRAQPKVTVRIADHTFAGLARIIDDEQDASSVRRLMAAKYQGWHVGQALSDWARAALPVGIDLAGG
jgi:deazaflavin-dependent oxidoreductase (nitroreductase family)